MKMCWGFLTLSCSVCALCEPTQSNTGKVEQLKKYLSESLPVELAVVQSRNDLASSLASNARGHTTKQPLFVTFQGSRQGDSFYVRQVNEDRDEGEPFNTNTVFAAGRSELVVWNAGKVGAALTSQKQPYFISRALLSEEEAMNFFKVGGTDSIAKFGSVLGGEIRRFLDLGLVDVKSGSVQFDGNKFTARLNRGKQAVGEILMEDQEVFGIKYQILGDKPYLISQFVYSSTTNVPGFLPTKVIQRVYGENGDFLRTNMIFEFLRLKLASQPLAPEHFLPDRFDDSATNRHPTILHVAKMNGISYLQTAGDKIAIADSTKQKRRKATRMVFLVLSALTLPGVIMLMMMAKKQGTTT